MPFKSGLVCPFLVHDNMTRKTHTVTEVTDTSAGRYYWIDGKSYLAGMFTILAQPDQLRSTMKSKVFAELYGKGTPVNDADFASAHAA